MTTLHEIKVPFHHWGRGEEDGFTPGCEHVMGEEYTGHVDGEARYHEAGYYVATDWGCMLITEIQRVSIPGYEDRIFYTRRWRDPLGNEFGKRDLKCKGARAFKQMLKGWRHPFYMDGRLVNAKGSL
ncbi:MAG: hypothetical protein LBJ15_19550 [Comamonas sp.]|jgi:hypothetical protein|uniref:hypothetical protein n=1 Tax=Comamonas sp. TaxID=34028 RepID=UPI00281ADFDF|nr:hypothetical protein [Comamonas sp.]MDR0216171.1 hypothetical protein [Comamonas sp.]